MYGIEAHETVNGTERITVSFEDETLELEFTEIEDGYEYTLIESTGLFAERQSKRTKRRRSRQKLGTHSIRYGPLSWIGSLLVRYNRDSKRQSRISCSK